MNIIVLHGDDVQRSYQRLQEIEKEAKSKDWQIERSLDNLNSTSLFTKRRVFVLYYDKALAQNILKKLPKEAKIEEFKLAKIIFKFLDSFYPKNAVNCLRLLHGVIKNEPAEFALALLAKQLRDLYWVSIDGKSLSYPGWRISRLKNQSSKFAQGEVKNLISELAKIDVEAKTSKAELVPSLDLLIASRLE